MGSPHYTKKCSKCREIKSVEEFYPQRNGRDAYCKECRRLLDRTKYERSSKHHARRKEEDPDYLMKQRLKTLYGITFEDYLNMVVAQVGRCAICRSPATPDNSVGKEAKLVVDHNHVTGKVRGLLCSRCNTRLAAIEDEQFMLLCRQYLRDTDNYEFVDDQ